ncbi:MAG TPA: T9SS type A sorting domain-containing protein [Bacteroidales bacterium]|nr:T9SS type A sorting domain-containing protein [Bacteroidales bacterium]
MGKTILSLMILLAVVSSSNGQIVLSSCEAPDSVAAIYKGDADYLALKRIFRNNLPYTDSVNIPSEYSNIVMKALLAVHNVSGLPARDTVIDLYHIHSCSVGVLNSMVIYADSNQIWMQHLRDSMIPTGNALVDSFMTKYNLTISYYRAYNSLIFPGCHSFQINSVRNYNMTAMSNLWDSVPGVSFSMPNSFLCPGMSLKDSIYADHVELTYSRGWGNCAAGCAHRYWKFNVYFDCSVEYLGSYGASVPLGVNDQSVIPIIVIPNPFNHEIKLEGITPPFDFSFFDISGRIVTTGKSSSNEIRSLDRLQRGLYFLIVKKPEISFMLKVVKE